MKKRGVKSEATLGNAEAWETGALGREEEFVVVAEDELTTGIDEALGLQPISIRLHKTLIEDFKLIARLNGIGYQPLMRQVLGRFAECEKRRILRKAAAAAVPEDQASASDGDNSEAQVA